MSMEDFTRTVDHAILKPSFTGQDIEDELQTALQYGAYSVCVMPHIVKETKDFYQNILDTGVAQQVPLVGTVIGFPHGVNLDVIKNMEGAAALTDGADELDVVLNYNNIIRHNLHAEQEFMTKFVTEMKGIKPDVVIKVIFENCYLTTEQIAETARAMQSTGVDFIKTSTGFGTGGATLEDVQVMVANAGDMQVKASGGVRTIEDWETLRDAGVTRFGTSNTAGIADAILAREEGVQLGESAPARDY